jgi:hypothetical protein
MGRHHLLEGTRAPIPSPRLQALDAGPSFSPRARSSRRWRNGNRTRPASGSSAACLPSGGAPRSSRQPPPQRRTRGAARRRRPSACAAPGRSSRSRRTTRALLAVGAALDSWPRARFVAATGSMSTRRPGAGRRGSKAPLPLQPRSPRSGGATGSITAAGPVPGGSRARPPESAGNTLGGRRRTRAPLTGVDRRNLRMTRHRSRRVFFPADVRREQVGAVLVWSTPATRDSPRQDPVPATGTRSAEVDLRCGLPRRRTRGPQPPTASPHDPTSRPWRSWLPAGELWGHGAARAGVAERCRPRHRLKVAGHDRRGASPLSPPSPSVRSPSP